MGRLLLAILMGYAAFMIMGASFLHSLISNPVETFHSMPLWFWGFGVWIFAGSFYTAGQR